MLQARSKPFKNQLIIANNFATHVTQPTIQKIVVN